MNAKYVRKVLGEAEAFGLPASWVRLLFRRKEAALRRKFKETYGYLDFHGLDALSLRVFEATFEAFGTAGLEMELAEALTLLKFAKVRELRRQDLKMSL